jgi:hypothetical protein
MRRYKRGRCSSLSVRLAPRRSHARPIEIVEPEDTRTTRSRDCASSTYDWDDFHERERRFARLSTDERARARRSATCTALPARRDRPATRDSLEIPRLSRDLVPGYFRRGVRCFERAPVGRTARRRPGAPCPRCRRAGRALRCAARGPARSFTVVEAYRQSRSSGRGVRSAVAALLTRGERYS